MPNFIMFPASTKVCLRLLFAAIAALVAAPSVFSMDTAERRSKRLGLGMNLSYLENYWQGSRKKTFSDFASESAVKKRRKSFSEIKAAGFKTVRVPINFGAWATLTKPYSWQNPQGLIFADQFVSWALKNDLNLIIDLHHVEFDGSLPGADKTPRVVWLWKEISERYKHLDPEKVFFEIRNEPHDVKPEVWRKQAKEIIKTVRRIAPDHTLIVGFHDWNSRKALIESKPFDDENIIYTFHYYDPFAFTHQGATWSAPGLKELKGVPFPFKKGVVIRTPEIAKGKWVGNLINSYEFDSQAAKMFADLSEAKRWSEKHRVPIFLGEFGSYSKYASPADRCRHARVVYEALGKLNIPNAWWEWEDGFSMFEKGTRKISGCMRAAVDSYYQVSAVVRK